MASSKDSNVHQFGLWDLLITLLLKSVSPDHAFICKRSAIMGVEQNADAEGGDSSRDQSIWSAYLYIILLLYYTTLQVIIFI
jgi:hypothetical protein